MQLPVHRMHRNRKSDLLSTTARPIQRHRPYFRSDPPFPLARASRNAWEAVSCSDEEAAPRLQMGERASLHASA